MPSAGDINGFKRLQKSTGNFTANIVKPPPKLPNDVKRRFPSLVKWEEDFHRYMQQSVGISIRGGTE